MDENGAPSGNPGYVETCDVSGTIESVPEESVTSDNSVLSIDTAAARDKNSNPEIWSGREEGSNINTQEISLPGFGEETAPQPGGLQDDSIEQEFQTEPGREDVGSAAEATSKPVTEVGPVNINEEGGSDSPPTESKQPHAGAGSETTITGIHTGESTAAGHDPHFACTGRNDIYC